MSDRLRAVRAQVRQHVAELRVRLRPVESILVRLVPRWMPPPPRLQVGRRIGAVPKAVWGAMVLVVLILVLVVGVLPIRSYFAQRDAVRQAEDRLVELVADNDSLHERAEALRSNDEIERLARAHYGLVLPGEESYAVVGVESFDGSDEVSDADGDVREDDASDNAG